MSTMSGWDCSATCTACSPRGHRADDGRAHLGQPFADIFGDDAFVLHDEDANLLMVILPLHSCDVPRSADSTLVP